MANKAVTTTWHCISLSRHEYESGELNVLLGAFHAAYVARNGPNGMAMFGRWGEDGNQYRVYVTPTSVRHILPILAAYSAKPSERPTPERLSLIFGDETGYSANEIGFEA